MDEKINVKPHVMGKEKKMKNMYVRPHATKCGAKTRSGTPCRNWGMANGRCRLHGGRSTGPRTAAGRERIRQAHWKHGKRSAQATKEHKDVRRWLDDAKKLSQEINEGSSPAKLKTQLDQLTDIEDKLIDAGKNFKYLTFRDRLAIAEFLRETVNGMLEIYGAIMSRQKS